MVVTNGISVRYRVRRLRIEQAWVRAILAAKQAVAAEPAVLEDPAALAAAVNKAAPQDCASCKVEAARDGNTVVLTLAGTPGCGDDLKGHSLASKFTFSVANYNR